MGGARGRNECLWRVALQLRRGEAATPYRVFNGPPRSGICIHGRAGRPL